MMLSKELTDRLLNDENIDLADFIRQLPENLESSYLLDCKNQLQKSLTSVTHEISESILKHQPVYIGELQRVTDLNKSIIDCIRICSRGRNSLKFIKNCPILLKHYQERESLKKLLISLTEISELRRSIIEIQNLIECQDFSRAIQMCKDSQVRLTSFEKFECVNDIGSKLENTLMIISDAVISKLCTTNYDPTTYPELRDAYFQLDRCDIAVDRALHFFCSFHSSSVEELKMFLENESWEMLPVKSDFSVMQLKEFSFLRDNTSSNATEDLFSRDTTQQQQNQAKPPLNNHTASYFDQPDALPLDRISISSGSDSELDREFIDEDEVVEVPTTFESVTNFKQYPYRLTRTRGPVLTNSSLNVLRLTGRYIQMMSVLSPISFEILMNIYKLLDQYTIFVFQKFGSGNEKQLEDVIVSLRESLIIGGQASMESATEMLNRRTVVANEQQQEVDPRKAVAIESLIFLINQSWNVHEYLVTLISPEQQIKLREQFSLNHSAIPNFLKARAELGPCKKS